MMETPALIYDRLWLEAKGAFERGTPQLDLNLADKTKDLRRGVTLILQPTEWVKGEISRFVDSLSREFPSQYYYRPEEYHVSVLSILSGIESWQGQMERVDACRTVIARSLSKEPPFRVKFQGVTASTGAVMIQGFPVDDGLARLRDKLRVILTNEGFGDMLDRRYRLIAAHITVMRFYKPEQNWKHLAELVKVNRQRNFGEVKVNKLLLTFGDWYASTDNTQLLQAFDLTD